MGPASQRARYPATLRRPMKPRRCTLKMVRTVRLRPPKKCVPPVERHQLSTCRVLAPGTHMIGGAQPTVLHVTTTDISLELLLGPQLEAFAAAGWNVIGASAPGEHVAALEARGIRHVPVEHLTRSMDPRADLLAVRELYRLFKGLQPDVVHTHNPKRERPACRLWSTRCTGCTHSPPTGWRCEAWCGCWNAGRPPARTPS